MSFMPAKHGAQPERAAHRIAIAGLLGLAVAMGVGRFAFTPLLPLMVAAGDITVRGGAWLAAANYLGYLVGALVALRVKGNAAGIIRVALLVTGVATIGMGFTDGIPAWLVLRWVAGCASAFLLVFISAWSLQRVSPLERPFLAAAPFAGVGAGIFGVGVVCLGLEHAGLHAPAVWVALGVITLLMSIAVWPVLAREEAEPAQTDALSLPRAEGSHGAWRFVLCYGLFGFGYIVPATFLPAIARDVAANGWTLDVSWPVFGLAACLSTFAAALATARGSALQVWRGGQIIMAIGVALPVFSNSLAALITAALCVGGTFMVVTMLGMQAAKQLAGAEARRLMAAMTAGFATGQLIGPLAVPYLIGHEGDFSRILIFASVILLLGVCVLPLRGRALYRERSGALKENIR